MLTLEMAATLACWEDIPIGGTLYDLADFAPHENCCDCCGGKSWTWRKDAICYANEWEAQMPCPVCNPVDGYD